MLRSEAIDKAREFELIQKSGHITQVEDLIAKNFVSYFETILESAKESKGAQDLAAAWNSKSVSKDKSKSIRSFFSQKIEEYEKEAEKYRSTFHESTLDEFMFDENAFKSFLTKECPVIMHSFYAKTEELREWQISYAQTASSELLAIFNNLTQFVNDYAHSYDEVPYSQYTEADEFSFDQIEDENFGIVGVIGMGIKSFVTYYLHPNIFPKRGKMDLFGLYFLTDRAYFHLPTKTSEFIMVNDKTHGSEGVYKIDQNYWYPYGLFATYAMKLYRKIADYCEKQGAPLDPHYRYVYVNAFLEGVAHHHKADIQTLTRSSNPQYAMSHF